MFTTPESLEAAKAIARAENRTLVFVGGSPPPTTPQPGKAPTMKTATSSPGAGFSRIKALCLDALSAPATFNDRTDLVPVLGSIAKAMDEAELGDEASALAILESIPAPDKKGTATMSARPRRITEAELTVIRPEMRDQVDAILNGGPVSAARRAELLSQTPDGAAIVEDERRAEFAAAEWQAVEATMTPAKRRLLEATPLGSRIVAEHDRGKPGGAVTFSGSGGLPEARRKELLAMSELGRSALAAEDANRKP